MDRLSLVECRYGPVRPVKRVQGLGLYLSRDTIAEEGVENLTVWRNPSSWFGPLYFGSGDERLYVPKRGEGGRPHPHKLVLNLCHKRGRPVVLRLMFVYFLALAAAILLLAAKLGYAF